MDHRYLRPADLRLFQALSHLLRRRAHQAAMRGHAHRQRDRAPGAGGLRLLHGARHGGGGPGDHDLSGGIEIHRLEHLALRRLLAKFAHGIVFHAQNRRHGALPRGNGLLHETRAVGDQLHGLDKLDRPGAHQRGIFAETVTGHVPRPRAVGRQPRAPGRHPGRQHGRLRDLGLIQLFLRSLLHQLPEVFAQGLRGLGEGLLHDGKLRCQGVQHADRLRTLPGKNECQCHMFRELYDYLPQRRKGRKENHFMTKICLILFLILSFLCVLCVFAARIHINISTIPSPR